MMKKYVALFLVLVTALSLMAGCAKEETPEQPQEPSTPEAPSTPADPAPQEQPVTVRLAGLKGKERRFDQNTEKEAMENVVLDFLK